MLVFDYQNYICDEINFSNYHSSKFDFNMIELKSVFFLLIF